MEENLVKEGERVDDLQYKGFRIIQDPNEFCFGMDAVLLANFAKVKKGGKVLDLGTGTGIIPLLIAAKTEAKEIYGIEIQEHFAEMASRSVKLNNVEDKVKILNGDLKNVQEMFEVHSFDVVTCNPPYKDKGTGNINMGDRRAIARHEIMCTLEDVIIAGSKMLNFGGKLCLVHRPHRLADIICLMRKHDVEPKRLRFVHPKKDKEPSVVLIEGAKGGRSELKVARPLIVYNDDGSYNDEIYQIYGEGV